MRKARTNTDPRDIHFGQFNTEPQGRNRNPSGEKQIRVPKNRKFANKPKEFVELIQEVLGNYLKTKKGFDTRRIRLILKISSFFITEDTYEQYINLPAPGLYLEVEKFITQNQNQ